MTPQLQTSAFLPSYFSPCAAMTQRFKRPITRKWINYPWRTREGRMGNPTFQFSYLLPKVALPARRKPLHSQLIEFLWISACSLIWDLWGKAQMWEQGRNGWQPTNYQLWHLNRVTGALRTARRCVSLPWFFRELVTSHVICKLKVLSGQSLLCASCLTLQ